MIQVLSVEQNTQVAAALQSSAQIAMTAIDFDSPEYALAAIKSAKEELDAAEQTIERAMATHLATY